MAKTEGRRLLRRPRNRWKDNIKGMGIIPVVRHGEVWGTKDNVPVSLNLDFT